MVISFISIGAMEREAEMKQHVGMEWT